MRRNQSKPHDGARAITVEYPDGTRLAWSREIPSNTWRCRVVAEGGEPMPDDAPIITGYDRPEMDRVLSKALSGTRESA